MTSPLKNNITNLQNLLDVVNSLPELPELSNEGTASDLLSGKQLIDDEGNIVNGTFTIDSELNTQDDLISQIQTALVGKASGGLPDGYVKPSVIEEEAGIYTPTTSDHLIFAGTYFAKTQTIKGDANLVAGNIKSGVSIFGVTGSYEGSGGSSTAWGTCTVEIVSPNIMNNYNCYYTCDDGTRGGLNWVSGNRTATVGDGSVVYICAEDTFGVGNSPISITFTGEADVFIDNYGDRYAKQTVFMPYGDCVITITGGS